MKVQEVERQLKLMPSVTPVERKRLGEPPRTRRDTPCSPPEKGSKNELRFRCHVSSSEWFDLSWVVE